MLQKVMEEDYKNSRAKFLLLWLIVNQLTGTVILWVSREGQFLYLSIIATALSSMIFLKFFLSLLNILNDWWNKYKVKRYMKK